MHTLTSRRRSTAALRGLQLSAVVCALGVVLAACGGGISSDAGGAAGEAAPDVATAGGSTAEERSAFTADSAAARSANRAPAQTRSVIRTGFVSATSEDLGAVREELDGLLAAFGGSVDRERTAHDEDGLVTRSVLVLRVPVADFTAAMDALKKLGKLEASRSNAEDVTTQVIDVDERVQTIQNSLDRLQRLQQRSASLEDLIDFEDQITQRESELRSLEAQQAYLADQTSMSTISLYLSTPEEYVPPPDALEDAGFLAGLRGGWNALTDSVVVALTVVGAVLPFAVTLAVAGIPLAFLLRGLVRRRRAPLPTE